MSAQSEISIKEISLRFGLDNANGLSMLSTGRQERTEIHLRIISFFNSKWLWNIFMLSFFRVKIQVIFHFLSTISKIARSFFKVCICMQNFGLSHFVGAWKGEKICRRHLLNFSLSATFRMLVVRYTFFSQV